MYGVEQFGRVQPKENLVTQDQVMALLRQLLPALGTMFITLGFVTPDAWATWSGVILTVAGPLFIIGSVIWSLFANTKASILTSAAQMPEVKKIELEPKAPASPALSQATPSNVVVSATPTTGL